MVRIGVVLLISFGIGPWEWWSKLGRTAAVGKKELAAAIAETDQLDPRWHWEEIEADRPAVPDAENSMRVIQELADSLNGWDATTLRLPDGEDFWSDEPAPANRQLDEERLVCLRKVLKTGERSLALAVSLKDFPHGRREIELTPDFVSTRLPHLDNCRSAYRLLELDIERLLDEGQLQEAADRIPAILNVAAGLRHEPSLLSQLVRIQGRTVAVRRVERILGMRELGDDELKRLMAVFKEQQGQNLLLIGLRGDRAGLHHLFENLESGRVSLNDLMAGLLPDTKNTDRSLRLASFLYEPHLYEDHAFTLRRYNDACAIAQLPMHEQMAAWNHWHDELATARAEAIETKRLIVSCLLIPGISRVGEKAIQDQAQLSCVLAVLAAERFRLVHQRWPKKLEELCPEFLPEVSTDPFDGKPLRLAHKRDGIAIYSVGRDGKDDGGENLDPAKGEDKNADLGLRLWDVNQRRLPPEPRKKLEEKDSDEEGNATNEK
jgi:hypothetical protein